MDSTTLPLPNYPALGEVFELTLDGDSPENDPLAMLRRDGYDSPEWYYMGKKVVGKQTRRFKLISVGYCWDFTALKTKLAKHGTIPESQWREALKAAYSSDGKGPVGIADSSWVHPSGGASFPCVGASGHSNFRWVDRGFRGGWRWLVEVS